MSLTLSETDSGVRYLDRVAEFRDCSVEVVKNSSREIVILSSWLDTMVYDNNEFHQSMIDFLRQSRFTNARVLVSNIQDMIERGHFLLRLSRRMSSRIEIRRLMLDPQSDRHAYVLGDGRHLLYKHQDRFYRGTMTTDTAAKCQSLVDEFNWLWEMHSAQDPSLRSIRI